MPTGTGLDGQLMVKAESVVGTPVTPDHAYEFDSESLKWQPTWIEPTGIRVGTKLKRASRLIKSRETVTGDIKLQHSTRNMGLLWKMALGSNVVTPTALTAPAFKQVHQPGDYIGKSMTIQAGRPEPSGTVRPHTYSGCKVASWEFSVSDGATAALMLSVDGWTESTATALAVPSFPAGASNFSFAQATVFKLGGVASTTTGVVSIASGVTVPTVVRSFSLKGDTPMATDRFGLGNAGIKKEQLENGIPLYTGSLDAEWDKTTFYDLFKANTTTALQLSLIGSAIGASGSNDTLDFVIPAIKFKNVEPHVDGFDVVNAKVDFEVYSDEANAGLQVTLINADSAL